MKPSLTRQRMLDLMAPVTADAKHRPGAISTLDVLATLYATALSDAGRDLTNPDRNRLFVSKGHGPLAYYAALAHAGLIAPDELATLGTWDSRLGHHPDRLRIPGVEISSGSLGHGLPLAVGAAARLRARQSPARLFCLLGDAEFDEGSNHEAIAVAPHWGLDNLTAIVIDNASATWGWPGGIATRFAIAGWETTTVDGHDLGAIAEALDHASLAPHAIVARVAPKGA